jgi:hypothetical protein
VRGRDKLRDLGWQLTEFGAGGGSKLLDFQLAGGSGWVVSGYVPGTHVDHSLSVNLHVWLGGHTNDMYITRAVCTSAHKPRHPDPHGLCPRHPWSTEPKLLVPTPFSVCNTIAHNPAERHKYHQSTATEFICAQHVCAHTYAWHVDMQASTYYGMHTWYKHAHIYNKVQLLQMHVCVYAVYTLSSHMYIHKCVYMQCMFMQ